MRLHGCLLVVLPCMALDTSNRNEKRARTSEQHERKHTQVEPAHHPITSGHGETKSFASGEGEKIKDAESNVKKKK